MQTLTSYSQVAALGRKPKFKLRHYFFQPPPAAERVIAGEAFADDMSVNLRDLRLK